MTAPKPPRGPSAVQRYTDWDDETLVVAACVTCKHKHAGKATCKAFPDGIPADVLDGRNHHTEPIEGDGGIVWEEA